MSGGSNIDLAAMTGDMPAASPTTAETSGRITTGPAVAAIHGFMHVAMHGRWREVVEEQFRLLRSSGLYGLTRQIFVALLGPDPAEFKYADDRVQVVYHSARLDEYEFPTLTRLHAVCRHVAPGNGLVYYLHTKGVFRDTPQTEAWRRYMQYFVIERHADCIRALAENDVCGVDWYTAPWPHFSGNFWWARADYVRTLPDVRTLSVVAHRDHTSRHNCERWIGTGPGVRAACLFQSHQDLYIQPLPRHRYAVPDHPEATTIGAPLPVDLQAARDVGEGHARATRNLDRPSPRAEELTICAAPEPAPIFGFMHVAMVNHWRQIVADQILKMRASGLWDRIHRVFVGILGTDARQFPFSDPKVHVMHFGADLSPAERPTLAHLQQFCTNGGAPPGSLLFYVHTKGTVHRCAGQEEWRRCMEHFVLIRHEDCIRALSEHDVCGINWTEAGWCRMFRGNFWWARAEYVQTLPDIRLLPPLPGLDAGPRHVCERWIGENRGVRAACLHDTGVDHYGNQPYPRSRYARLREVGPDQGHAPSAWSGLENRFQDLLEPLKPLSTIVEIGVEWGHSLFCLAAAAPGAAVIGVDPYDEIPAAEERRLRRLGNRGVVGSAAAEAYVRDRLGQHRNVSLMKTTGAKAAERVRGPVDVLHLDAVHTYEDVRMEFLCWQPKLRAGGCVLLHDTISFPDDVGRFFRELPGRKAEIPDCGGLGAWYKPAR